MTRNILIPIFCLLLFSTSSYADHFDGGEIRYEYDSLDYYRIYVTLYKNCDAQVTPPLLCGMKITSSCMSDSIWVQCIDSQNIYAPWCPSVTPTCGPYKITRKYSYTGLAHLPPCSDWVISFAGNFMSLLNNNLDGPGGITFYTEATLDNSFALNTSAIIQNDPPFTLSVNSFHSIPLQTTDADGDSITYAFDQQPLQYPYSFKPPYNINNQIGNYSALDNEAQMFYVNTDLQGNFYTYIRINEYRNGNLVGSRTRAWVTTVTTGFDPEVPLPNTGSNFTHTTYAGQTDSITLSFTDSASADSVFAGFQLPTYPNFNYSISSIPGVGAASVKIVFTTPANYNAADSPYFNLPIYVHDNACDLQGYAYYNALLYIVQPGADSVWPGDANSDHVVNMYDPLAIAVAYGNTGTTRVGANINWTAQYSANWPTTYVTGVNHKNGDCNGDGIINSDDTLAVTYNYGFYHPKQHGIASKASGLPTLEFDHTGITFSPGATVTIPLKLGDLSLPINGVYGIATNIGIQGLSLSSAPSFNYTSSWIGNNPGMLQFRKELGNANIDWVYSRTDHQNVNGQGDVGTMTFTVPASASIGDMIIFHLEHARIIDKNGNEVTGYNVADDTAYVYFPVNVNGLPPIGISANIVPNPSCGNTSLQLNAGIEEAITISICDITGRAVFEQIFTTQKGSNTISLPAQAKGIYIVHVQGTTNAYRQNIKWVIE